MEKPETVSWTHIAFMAVAALSLMVHPAARVQGTVMNQLSQFFSSTTTKAPTLTTTTSSATNISSAQSSASSSSSQATAQSSTSARASQLVVPPTLHTTIPMFTIAPSLFQQTTNSFVVAPLTSTFAPSSISNSSSSSFVSAPAPVCGNNMLEQGEECDIGGYCLDNNQQFCTNDADCRYASHDEYDTCQPYRTSACDACKRVVCGDGRRHASGIEACDDGKHCVDGTSCTASADCMMNNPANPTCTMRSGDGCSDSCTAEICGDGKVPTAGRCLKGFLTPGPERYCQRNEICPDGSPCYINEQCDGGGGNTASCDSDCSLPECGDERLNTAAGETCDNGKHCQNGVKCTFDSECSDGSLCQVRADATCDATCHTITPKTCCNCYFDAAPECAGRTAAQCENYECNDGIDNDGDGKTDAADAQCTNIIFNDPDASESQPGVQRNNCVLKDDGRCAARQEERCADQFSLGSCDVVNSYPASMAPQTFPSNLGCTSTVENYMSHDTYRGPNNATLCPTMSEVSFVCCGFDGCPAEYGPLTLSCRAFATKQDAYTEVDRVQRWLKRQEISSIVIQDARSTGAPECREWSRLTVRKTSVAPPAPTIATNSCAVDIWSSTCDKAESAAKSIYAIRKCDGGKRWCTLEHPGATFTWSCDASASIVEPQQWIPFPYCSVHLPCTWTCDW